MVDTKTFDANNKLSTTEKQQLVRFLHDHLQEYGDSTEDIQKAIEYATREKESFGGFVVALVEKQDVLGVVVVNQTGMGGYIPENILVYIATHQEHRGKGLGKKLMETAISLAQGDIALHVEANNPARFLYEKLGFTNPYLEMRLKK